ncbi:MULTISPECIES: isoprenylcysteine carboxylmethyltransferase family protein [unclassified Mesorhizobium]|nr:MULTISPECIES: isoprenylcysteine carboxylmethyltransferase family protein [unclassified Mesorhizobium]TGQ42620.1 isoprenylcysteine carboxylmethyltransferase family protein [Mesorhizobium sp. M00.F.Ca.ET.216.01.1.1]TIS55380.1 MAG: isoprenylcysteine carboxylmethyltransferase family protein [Mesorhizobium sp.]TIS90010.1 MAG: isoprenylcysteine carboxylmethyltransferase family protein [Mesorhizobium sp.]TJW09548.1 MAG: isoprenylcysteine carboxylmethyltransferase family protein [Mesorhizobium sp.]
MHPATAIATLWLIWIVSWAAAAFWADRAEKRAGFQAELSYRAVLVLGTILFVIPAHGYVGRLRLWIPNLAEAWICAALIAAGLAFTWWARLHLGRLWSGTVTAKAAHRVVDTGPYALVRHPIYTGLLLAILATMAAKGTVWGIAGAALLTVGIVMKARLEERFLRTQLGAAYDDYIRRVPMLVPFAPK